MTRSHTLGFFAIWEIDLIGIALKHARGCIAQKTWDGLQPCDLKQLSLAFLQINLVTSMWESTLLLTLVSQLSAMQVSQLLHEALLCLDAVLLACNQTPDMPFMLTWPTP